MLWIFVNPISLSKNIFKFLWSECEHTHKVWPWVRDQVKNLKMNTYPPSANNYELKNTTATAGRGGGWRRKLGTCNAQQKYQLTLSWCERGVEHLVLPPWQRLLSPPFYHSSGCGWPREGRGGGCCASRNFSSWFLEHTGPERGRFDHGVSPPERYHPLLSQSLQITRIHS